MRVPLDAAIDAPAEEKLDAAAKAVERMDFGDVNSSASVYVEVVEDGEPVGDALIGSRRPE